MGETTTEYGNKEPITPMTEVEKMSLSDLVVATELLPDDSDKREILAHEIQKRLDSIK